MHDIHLQRSILEINRPNVHRLLWQLTIESHIDDSHSVCENCFRTSDILLYFHVPGPHSRRSDFRPCLTFFCKYCSHINVRCKLLEEISAPPEWSLMKYSLTHTIHSSMPHFFPSPISSPWSTLTCLREEWRSLIVTDGKVKEGKSINEPLLNWDVSLETINMIYYSNVILTFSCVLSHLRNWSQHVTPSIKEDIWVSTDISNVHIQYCTIRDVQDISCI